MDDTHKELLAAYSRAQNHPNPRKCTKTDYFFIFIKEINIAGRSTRLVKVAVINVIDVNQPKALVPSKPLKQKITNPAIRTKEV